MYMILIGAHSTDSLEKENIFIKCITSCLIRDKMFLGESKMVSLYNLKIMSSTPSPKEYLYLSFEPDFNPC